jgi:hypothetical protein
MSRLEVLSFMASLACRTGASQIAQCALSEMQAIMSLSNLKSKAATA